MRSPLQILAIPYRMVDGKPIYCLFRRSDSEYWQFIAGGGEDNETPIEAVRREIFEEGGVKAENIIQLTSMCYVQVDIFRNRHLYGWPKDMYVVPEYAFGFECNDEILLSHEHTEYAWLTYDEARAKCKWDSNRTALYELNCILSVK